MPRDSTIVLQNFWTSERILFLIFFILGFALGAVAMDFYANFSKGFGNDYNSMLEINQRLSERNSQLYSCLVENKVEPEAC